MAKPQDVSFGDWVITGMTGTPGAFASTVNKQGDLFGKFCPSSLRKCMWLVVSDIPCKIGVKYRLLSVSTAGRKSHEVVCVELSSKPTLTFLDSELIFSITKTGNMVRFNYPRQDGSANEVSFSLRGASEAIAGLQQISTQK